MTPREHAERLFQQGESEEEILRRLGETARADLREFRDRTRREREALHNRLISADPPEIDPSEIPIILRTFSVWLIELESRIDQLYHAVEAKD